MSAQVKEFPCHAGVCPVESEVAAHGADITSLKERLTTLEKKLDTIVLMVLGSLISAVLGMGVQIVVLVMRSK